MSVNRPSIILITMTIPVILLGMGCDLFENEGGDWKNDVTVKVTNNSDCLISLYIDGIDETSMNPQDTFEKTGINRGVHLLEAYPWNDVQFSCDHVFTPELKKNESFEWTIVSENGCTRCDPTPTPQPDTPTPSPTASPEAA